MPSYTVVKGDTLSGIAAKQGLGANNWSQLGYTGDPTKLQVGTVLNWGDTQSNSAPSASVTPAFSSAPATTPTRTDYTTAANSAAQAEIDRVNAQNAAMDTLAGSQESSADMYKRLSEQYGLPDLSKTVQEYKDQIYGIQGTLNDLEGNVNDRTKGYKVNEAQRSRILTSEQNPLQHNLSALGIAMAPASDALTAAQSNITQQMGFEQTDQNKAIELMSDKFARESTGYKEADQTRLDALLEQVKRGETLSDQEHSEAVTLAAKEADYQHDKDMAAISFSNSKALQDTSGDNFGQVLSDYLNGKGQGATTNSSSAPKRAGNTDNISYGGKTYTRENFAAIMAGTNNTNDPAYKEAYTQVMSEFPDYNKQTSYISPTALFGMKG